jgi:hypothetical protein
MFGSSGKYPEDWPAAIKADNRPVDTGLKVGADNRNYSESSPGEDFAEAFKSFVIAKMKGKAGLASFSALYPNRAKILEQLWNRTRGS